MSDTQTQEPTAEAEAKPRKISKGWWFPIGFVVLLVGGGIFGASIDIRMADERRAFESQIKETYGATVKAYGTGTERNDGTFLLSFDGDIKRCYTPDVKDIGKPLSCNMTEKFDAKVNAR